MFHVIFDGFIVGFNVVIPLKKYSKTIPEKKNKNFAKKKSKQF